MKRRDWEKDRKAMIVTVPVSALWRFFKLWRDERRRKKVSAALAKLHRAPWRTCQNCENYWCEIHKMHAHDCPCPPAEEWERSPYAEKPR